MKNEEIMKHLNKKTNEIFIDGNLELEDDLNTKRANLRVRGNIVGTAGLRWNISAGNISAGDISAGDILAGNILAWNILARNISAGNISAGDISAGDILARNISAWNISARNISYYAVCFAYQNIKCKSIKGRREKSKHFCFDGKVIVEGKKERKK
jgi:hypothetical protein